MVKIVAAVRFAPALLLRHRARRFQHIEQRINRLYHLKDLMGLKLRGVLATKKQASITAGNLVVALEQHRFKRRCRKVVGPLGEVRILEPGYPTRLTVRKKTA